MIVFELLTFLEYQKFGKEPRHLKNIVAEILGFD